MADQLNSVVARLEAVTSRLEGLAQATSAGGTAGESAQVARFVEAFETDIINGSLAKYISLSADIGGDVNTQALKVKAAFDAQKTFLDVASKSKQPDQATTFTLLQPCAKQLQEVQEFREANRQSTFFQQLSAVSESIAALGWVTVVPTPVPFVKDLSEASMFYLNRVLKEFKDTDDRHVAWAKAWQAVFKELQTYIKEFHTTGLTWNTKGGDAKAAAASPSSSGAPAPPPPPGPPPPPPPPATLSSGGGAAGGDDRGALFAQLNKGEDVTKGLRKVTDDMKTHKNPQLRQGPAPFKPTPSAKPTPAAKPGAPAKPATSVKPPKLELEMGKKWLIEYQKDNKNIVLENTELRQSVYAFKCEGTVIQVKGKINSIILDSCKKTAIVFDDLVSSLEFVNCQSMQAQVLGYLPTVSIDKTDGCQVYLSDKSINTEIVTAKSSEMNICVPTPDGDMREFALPEQFKTMYNGKTMVTSATESL